ncbi:unnamed protein product [Rhizophagus irregularis]|nr:unnamed protein product [Rhizophagus irregularis]
MISELESRIRQKEKLGKKNRKFQTRCIQIAKEILNEEPIIEYRPPFLDGLELDAFFQKYRIALEVQGAQHRLHNTNWYKDVKKLEDIVNRDRQKRCICLDSGIFLIEVCYSTYSTMSSMSLNTEDSKNSVNTVKKLAKMFSLGLRDIPDVIKENADKVLEVIEKMCIDDPIVIIKWTVPFPRNVRGQTERSLINHIVTNGGTNEFNSNIIFFFRSGRQLTNCVKWSTTLVQA